MVVESSRHCGSGTVLGFFRIESVASKEKVQYSYLFVLGRRVILLSREVLIDVSQRENAWRTRESGLLPVPKTFEPRTGAQPDRFAALPNPGIHSPIPPEIEPDVLTDMCRLRVAQGGFRQMLACCAYDEHRLIRCMRMVVVCLVVSDVRYRAIL